MLKVVKKSFILLLSVVFAVLLARPVKAEELSLSGGDAYVTISNVNFRSAPSLESDKLALIPRGSTVTVSSYDADGWSRAVYDGSEGYISSEYIVLTEDYTGSNVELLAWNEMKDIFAIGVDAEVYDIWSGQVYYVRSFSNGSHADVEPVTTEDTAIMKSTYGGAWSWDPRPVLVTINGRTVAAAINGMPHGGGVNSNNGMDGQVCLHFMGSAVHNGNTSYQARMQEAVMQAWESWH